MLRISNSVKLYCHSAGLLSCRLLRKPKEIQEIEENGVRCYVAVMRGDKRNVNRTIIGKP